MKSIQLQKSSYHSAKVSVYKSSLFSEERFSKFLDLSFEEILKYLEEHGFRKSIDKSYSRYEGFYLVEKFLNDYLAEIYDKILNSAPSNNKKLYNLYYLKYQIHNLMVVLRCKESKEDEFEAYLIGDRRKREKFIKAFNMANLEDGISYLCSKLNFDNVEVLKKYKQGLFELENYLYQQYYLQLHKVTFEYNKKDEIAFDEYIKGYVDLINARSFLRLKSENVEKLSFEEIYLEGGNLSKSFFKKLESKDLEESIKAFSKYFNSTYEYAEFSDILHLDKTISQHKQKSASYFGKVPFGSPFYAFKFLFDLERQIAKLRILLKAKYLNLEKEEVKNLL